MKIWFITYSSNYRNLLLFPAHWRCGCERRKKELEKSPQSRSCELASNQNLMRISLLYDTMDRFINDLAIAIIHHPRVDYLHILELQNTPVLKRFLEQIVKLQTNVLSRALMSDIAALASNRSLGTNSVHWLLSIGLFRTILPKVLSMIVSWHFRKLFWKSVALKFTLKLDPPAILTSHLYARYEQLSGGAEI